MKIKEKQPAVSPIQAITMLKEFNDQVWFLTVTCKTLINQLPEDFRPMLQNAINNVTKFQTEDDN